MKRHGEKKSLLRILLAICILFGTIGAGRINAQAKVMEKIKIYTPGPAVGESIYRYEDRTTPLGTQKTITFGGENKYMVEIPDYNKKGFRKGVKWTRLIKDYNSYGIFCGWKEETMGADDKFGDSEEETDFYYLYIMLDRVSYFRNSWELPADSTAFEVYSQDVPDHYIDDAAEVEIVNEDRCIVKIAFLKSNLFGTFRGKLDITIDEPEAGKKIEDIKITDVKDGKVLKESVKCGINIADSWYRLKNDKDPSASLEQWEKVSGEDVFEPGYYYQTTAMDVVKREYFHLYTQEKNHAKKGSNESYSVLPILPELTGTQGIQFTINGKAAVGYYETLAKGLWKKEITQEVDCVYLTTGNFGLLGEGDGTAAYADNWNKLDVDTVRGKLADGSYPYTKKNVKEAGWTNGVKWEHWNKTDWETVKNGDDLIAGDRYRVTCQIGCLDKYRFAPNVKWYLDGIKIKEVSQGDDEKELELQYEYILPSVSSFVINDTVFRNGDTPVYTAQMGADRYQLSGKEDSATRKNGIQWSYYYEDNAFTVSNDPCIQSDSRYYIDYILEPTEGNCFPAGEYWTNNMLVSANSGTAELISCTAERAQIRVLVEPFNAVTDVRIVIPSRPVAGMTPSDTGRFYFMDNGNELVDPFFSSAYIGHGYGYNLQNLQDQWLESTDDMQYVPMTTETFVEGKYYGTKLVGIIKTMIGDKARFQEGSLGIRADASVYVNDQLIGVWKDLAQNFRCDFGKLDGTEKIDIASAILSNVRNKVYTGSALTQDITLKLGDVLLKEGIDYTVSYENNVEPGEAKLIVTGSGNYAGYIERSFTIWESAKEISTTADISEAVVSGIVDKVYTGSEIRQEIVVMLGGTKLTEGKDYTVSYTNNTAVGEAGVIITGIGKMKGTIKKTFRITAGCAVTEPGVGTVSGDGKTLTDTEGKTYRVADTVTTEELKKGLTVADKKTGGKYRITQIYTKLGAGLVMTVVGGTVEYVAPYNKNTKKIAATNSVKLAGITFKVTSIGAGCGKGCTKLAKVVIGPNITQIGKNAFKGCKKLKSVQIKSKSLKKVGGKAFKGIHKKAVIKVPKAKMKAYRKLLKGKTIAKIK